jgi:1-deoxy-D-xylulose-5-phosphate synthase
VIVSILENINTPSDLQGHDKAQLNQLSEEIREYLVSSVSAAGGHLASNLGVVELSIAIHKVYDTSKDRLVFDVGHQCYVHKLFTDRREAFKNLRKLGGISGYPKPCESEHDAFVAGHASNSISVALGMARARTLTGGDYDVVALIGDGALTGGLAYEALNDAGESGEPLVIILNDNGMSIRKSVGGITSHLAHQRIKPAYYSFKLWYRKVMSIIPGGKSIYRFTHKVKTMIKEAIFHCSLFEEMGFQYLGPVDGHDTEKLINYLEWAKHLKAPALVHVTTVKGKGYAFSEEAPDDYHGVGKFDPETGVSPNNNGGFSGKFGQTICALAERDERICAITAAMADGTGLAEYAKRFPKRFFDVGIAEQHAAAMAAGMAKQGLIPVFAVYSSFLQRSYDMLLHDVAIQNLHVVLAVDRAGLVGEDGETHHGVFDVNFLSGVPGMTILCPSSYSELKTMLEYAVLEVKGPVAVRYPRGKEGAYYKGNSGIETVILREGKDITLAAYGTMINAALHASEILEKKGISAEVLKIGQIIPIDLEPIIKSSAKTNCVIVAEECINEGSVGQRIIAGLAERKCLPAKIKFQNLGDSFVPQGTMTELYRYCRIDGESLAEEAEIFIRGTNNE